MRSRSHDDYLRRKITALCGRDSGMTRTDLHNAVKQEHRLRAFELLELLHAAGELHRRRAGKRGWRYFASAAAAEQFRPAAVDLLPPVKGEPAPANPRGRPPKRQVLDSDAPADTSLAEVTICPSVTHDPRVQCAPGERVWGCGFAALGPGRYLPEGPASCAAKAVSR